MPTFRSVALAITTTLTLLGCSNAAPEAPSSASQPLPIGDRAASSGTVEMRANGFFVDGVPRLLRGGTVQWFRLPREEWDDRLARFAAAGFNTVDVYVAWRNHEPVEGVFDFETYDLRAFLDLAKKHGLYVYLRPGPYITNEMDGGGVPAWLFTKTSKRTRDGQVADGTVNPRTNDRDFLDAVERYFAKLNEVVRPYLHTNGGPVVLYSLENEYNWFQTFFDIDKLFDVDGVPERDPAQVPDVAGYFAALRDIVKRQGIDVPLTTCPGAGAVEATGDVAEIAPLPNFYKDFGFLEHKASAVLRDMHDPTKHGGVYTAMPSGTTETERTATVLRRLVLAGLDGVFHFNVAGMHQENRQNSVVLNANGASAGAILGKLFELDRTNATTGFFRPSVGYFHNVVDYYGAIGPSGTLRKKFEDFRRINAFLTAYEPLLAAAGEPKRTVRRALLERGPIAFEDTRLVVKSDALGTRDPDVRGKASYWLSLGDDAAVLGLYNDGTKNVTLERESLAGFGRAFPRFSTMVVPTETSPAVASGAAVEREYSLLVPIGLPVADGVRIGYATSEIFTKTELADETLLVLYGASGSSGELRLELPNAVVDAAAGVRVEETTPTAVTVTYAHGAPVSFVVRGGSKPVRVPVLDAAAAGRTWIEGEGADRFVLVGPRYVSGEKGARTLEIADDEGPRPITILSPSALALGGLTQEGAWSPTTRLATFRPTPGPAQTLPVRLERGRTKDDAIEGTLPDLASGFRPIGDAPRALEELGIVEGHAWYRAEVTLTDEEAKAPGPLFVEHASDFVGVYVNGRYLLTLAPHGTEIDSASGDADYGFAFPPNLLRPGRNVFVFRTEIWGHGSFMWPRGTFHRLPGASLPVPFVRGRIPALGFDSLRGLFGAARLGTKALTNWSVKPGLAGEALGHALAATNDAAWAPNATFPLTLAPGAVTWYRAHISGSALPDPERTFTPLVLRLAGRATKATIWVNGRLVGRWLSDTSWLQRGSWTQPDRAMWMNTSPDDFPLARGVLREGDNVVTLALEDTSDTTAGSVRGVVTSAEIAVANEEKSPGVAIADRARSHTRLPLVVVRP